MMQIQPDKPLPHMQVTQAPPVQTRHPTSSGSLRGKRSKRFKNSKTQHNDRTSHSVEGVHNLSKTFTLDTATSSLLLKGHKFIPTSKPSSDKEILGYVSELRTTLNKRAFFLSNPSNEPYNPDLKVKSSWVPPSSRAVDNFIIDLTNRLEKMLEEDKKGIHSKPNNLLDMELRALKILKNNKAIVIKVSDKNLGLTIMDFSWYDMECLRQLHDATIYLQLESEEVERVKFTTKLMLEKFILKYKDVLTKQEMRFLQKNLQRPGVPLFYILPKLHKNPVVGRPIVAGHSWVTVGCSKLLTSYFKKLLPKFPNILKDSTTLIKILETTTFSDDVVLCTLDVISLYTNIPVEHAIEVLKQVIQENLELFPTPDLPKMLIEMLEFVLKNNIMEYKGMVFKQIFGIAMGTPLAPVLANLYLAFLERILAEKADEKGILWPTLYKRFIDDCFIVYEGQKNQLLQFINLFNSLVSSITLSLESFGISANFLDLTIYKGNRFMREGKLDLKIYQKPLNKYLYLPFNTDHPTHCKKSFVTSELRRYVKGSSDHSVYTTVSTLFYSRLLKRGYPDDIICEWFQTVQYSNRMNYLFKQDEETSLVETEVEEEEESNFKDNFPRYENSKPLIYKVQYNQRIQRLDLASVFKQTVEDHRSSSASFKAITEDLKPLICFTRGTNLGQSLIKARTIQESV